MTSRTDSPGSEERLTTRVNPPIRGSSEARALLEGLRSGVLDYIASDHAPHHPDEKQGDSFDTVRAGVTGVEHMLPVLWSSRELLDVTAAQLVHWLSRRPAQVWGLWPDKGAMRVGSDADLVVVGPDAEWQLDGGHSLHPSSPYRDVVCRGRVVLTVLAGSVIAEQGRVAGTPRGAGSIGLGRVGVTARR